MLTIAMRLPVALEVASPTGSTKDASRGLLFSDSLEQAGGLQTTSTAQAAQRVRRGDDEARTADGGAVRKTPGSPLPAKKEFAEVAADEIEVAAEAVTPLSPKAVASLSTKMGDVSETVSEENVVEMGGENRLAKRSPLDLAEHAELGTPVRGRPLRPISPTPPASFAVDDGKTDVAERSTRNGIVGPALLPKKPVAVIPEPVSCSPATHQTPLPGDVVTLAPSHTPVNPTDAVLAVVDHGNEKKVSASEKTKASGSVGTPDPKERVVADATLFPFSLSSAGVLSARQQGPAIRERTNAQSATEIEEPNIGSAAAASVPVTPYQVTQMASGLPGEVLDAAATIAMQNGAKGSSMVGRKHPNVAEDKQTKSKSGRINGPAVVVGNVAVAPAVANASQLKALNPGDQPAAFAIVAATPAAQTSSVSSHGSLLGKASSSAANTQSVGKAAGSGVTIRDATSGSPSVPDVMAPDSPGPQAEFAVSDARSEAGLFSASTIDGVGDAHALSGAAALATRSIKTTAVGGTGGVRKSVEPPTKMSELNVASTAVTQDASSLAREARTAPGHLTPPFVEEKKTVDVGDSGSRASAALGSITNQTPASSTVTPVANGSAALTPSPLASAVRNDAAVSSGDSSIMQHQTLQATPTVLEVGVPGGTRGWLKIRAEVGEGGTIRASISSPTQDGQEALRRDLPGMSAYLESERVPVSVQVGHIQGLAGGLDTVRLEPSGSTAQATGDGSGTMMDAAAQQQSQREQAAAFPAGTPPGEEREPRTRQATQELEKAAWSPGEGYASGGPVDGGNWLNVMA